MLNKILIFVSGAALSGFVCYRLGYLNSKKKYEDLADREVASIRKMLIDRYENGMKKQKTKKTEETSIKISPIEESRTLKVEPSKKEVDYGKQYRTTTEIERIPGTPSDKIKYLDREETITSKPYIITPEEFHDSEYECSTLFYCADKVLTDDDYNQIMNIGIVGGYPILNEFENRGVDCLYVRDDKKGIDYEILLEERTYNKIRPLGVIDEED